jgi:uncharacterized protein YyaL (SSP411 family)
MMPSSFRPRRLLALALALPLLLVPARADDKPHKGKPRHTNRLARESSPYLLQHAHNPVNWYPWGEEAFAKARKEGKLVFLSIGYSSCHWCHVMERESFESEEVARLLNDSFVCIKVDREERPDVDDVYMTALTAAMGHSGGWPLSMFLTAEGKPIFGGTYWPREDREIGGRKVRGFKYVLGLVQDVYKEKPEEIKKLAEQNAERTATALAGLARGQAIVTLDRRLVRACVDDLLEHFDRRFGGFGSADSGFRGPKFPMPSSLMLLLGEAGRSKSKELDDAIALTLAHMAEGGIYDQLGGGFHRYSTERTWTVPHFEKMLYDNAQLLEVYALAYRRTNKSLYRRVLEETIGFTRRSMTSPEGGFYSALDADAAGVEGRTYVWERDDIARVLPEKKSRRLFEEVYGVAGEPNFEEKYYILHLPKPLAEVAAAHEMSEEQLLARLKPLREALLEARVKRPQPLLDTKVLTAWNGQMIAGLARAGAALGQKEPVEMARRAAGFVLAQLRTKEGRLLRSYGAAPGEKAKARLNGYLDDYAFLVHGLLCLHEATKERRWLDEAKALTETMIKYHADERGGGFYYTSSDHEKLFARSKDQSDGAQPSGNSVAADNLVRLWKVTGEERYRRQAEKTFKALAGPLKINPGSLPALADALALYLEAAEKK